MSQPLQEPIQFGKYTLFERIGRGGMADVFKGRVQGPGGFERIFVVKRILPNLSDDPAFIKMFVEEAKLSARLNHPNIVQVFELGAVEGEYFISMEHVVGHDLSETMRALWRSSGPPRADLVAYVGREMCRALAYAHGLTDEQGSMLGMIHRDVSPSNVMLSYEGAVKLLDFGIAKALGDAGETTKSGTLKGKYAYMAPEQTEHDEVDHRIDIFAAGIVLHEVLTGRRLFKGANDVQTIERVRRCEVRPPSQFNSGCPPEMDAIVLRALARNRDDRFQNAGEMADALDEIVHASHFTPQHMAAILRETFGGEPGAVTGTGERRPTATSSSISTTSPSAVRSPTIPPVAVPRPMPAAHSNTIDSPIPAAVLAPPIWKRGSSWAVAAVCAAGIAFGVFKGVGGKGDAPTSNEAVPVAQGAHSATAAKKIKRVPVLIQSDPEAADVYVAGKLESIGTTPTWLNLELDKANPTRVMLRKAGFQDKAIAIESERPPMVDLIPITPVAAPEPAAGAPAVADDDEAVKDGAGHADDSRSGGAKSTEHRSAVRRPAGKRARARGELVDPF